MFDITTADLIREQRADKTLAPIWAMADKRQHKEVSNYFIDDGMLCKGSSPKDEENGEGRSLFQIVIPKCYRKRMLELAHNIPTSGHMGQTKTIARLACHFYWPGITKDVQEYVQTCPVCQKTAG